MHSTNDNAREGRAQRHAEQVLAKQSLCGLYFRVSYDKWVYSIVLERVAVMAPIVLNCTPLAI